MSNNDTGDYVLEMSRQAVSREAISSRQCFACGREPTSGRGEHVIPLWLQRQFNLGNETINLINGTRLSYRQLTIPCCEACNTGFLSSIEKSVKPIFTRAQVESVSDKMVLGRWLAKILIGLLVKETSLLFDRARADSGPIVPPEFIEELQHAHFLLQSARKQTVFSCLHGELPFSLYHYRIDDDGQDRFDLSTNVAGLSISIMGSGLGVCFINDGGLQMEVGPKGPYDLLGATVSQTQFRELTARIHYKAALRDGTHAYLTSESPESIHVNQLKVIPFSPGFLPGTEQVRVFREWHEDELSYVLAHTFRMNHSEWFDDETGMCRTTLLNEVGSLAVVRPPDR